MAKWAVGKGMDEYLAKLGLLGEEEERMIGRAVHDGAGVVADAIRAGINALPVNDTGWYTATEQEKAKTVTATQKAGLQEGFGISAMKNDSGFLNVKLGFDGYNGTRTKAYPQGQPNAMIARAVEAGTSFRERRPFVAPAVRASKKAAEEAMRARIDEQIKSTMN